eukprot:scaffold130455_cov69-Phaeocystis_antarctica.AAC.5
MHNDVSRRLRRAARAALHRRAWSVDPPTTRRLHARPPRRATAPSRPSHDLESIQSNVLATG